MATRTIRATSSANAIKGQPGGRSFLWELASALNQLILNQILGNPAFARNANFDVANANALSYRNAGVLKTLGATTNFDTGTAKTIPTVRWAAGLLSISAAGAGVVTWGTGDYASEALAIAALKNLTNPSAGANPALPAGNTPAGYITVLAAGVTWTAGTDALAGGAGGTPATTTNYYNGDVDDIIVSRELGQP